MSKTLLSMIAICTLAAVQIIYYYPLMPQEMASHFNAAGVANGWMPKQLYFGLYGVALLVLTLVFARLPRSIMNYPDSKINLPNKAYWLSPEHRTETGAIFEKYLGRFGVAVSILFVVVFQMTLQANRVAGGVLSNGIKLALSAFLAFCVVWMFTFVRAFRR